MITFIRTSSVKNTTSTEVAPDWADGMAKHAAIDRFVTTACLKIQQTGIEGDR